MAAKLTLKKLNAIRKTLKAAPLSSLPPEDFYLYLDHRIQAVLEKKRILTLREINYLLTEVGPGNLRFDEELVGRRVNQPCYELQREDDFAKHDEVKELKLRIQKGVNDSLSDARTSEVFLSVFSAYFQNARVMDRDPMVFSASYHRMPVLILAHNGRALWPGTRLLSFLRYARERQSLPIIISKRIHGVLFPFFKEIGCLGTNTFTTLTTQNVLTEVEVLRSYSFGELSLVDYHERLEGYEEFSKSFSDSVFKETILKRFLTVFLPKLADRALNKFMEINLSFVDDFGETLDQLPRSKAKSKLLLWNKQRSALLAQEPGPALPASSS